MQGAEFVNDLRYNYLVVPYMKTESDFALRMLIENVTDKFLTVELRRLDGQTFLYYNISGMQNMEIIHGEKPIDQKAFQIFMWNLHEAIEQCGELFLPGDGICLEPMGLFWDLNAQRWKFVYVPKQEEQYLPEIQAEREQLAEFLVMHIDYEDKRLTETVYRFYEEICAGRMQPNFFLEREDKKFQEEPEPEQDMQEDIIIDDQWEEVEESEYDIETEKETSKKGLQILLIVLWCLAAGGTAFFGRSMGEVILPGGAVTAVLTLLLFYIRRKRRKYGETDQEDTDMTTMEKVEIPYHAELTKEQETEEKTVYFDIGEAQEKRLYGIGKFRREKIVLDSLPCTVGKDGTLSDHIISDSSVSRMHARFYMEEETFRMQDLNSTNGTYHNGIRLRPNEKVILEKEDEVGFGRVQFIFR